MGREARLRLAGRESGIVRPDGTPARAARMALGFAFGTLHWPFVRSIIGLRERGVADMAAGRVPLVRDLIPQQGLYIGENRNRIVQRFLGTDADWLLQVDTDIEFPPELPEMMLALAGSARKIVAASVPLSWSERDGTPLPSCGMNRKPDVPGQWIYLNENQVPEAGIEVDAVASAVLLIHREVFLAIADQVGQCWFLQTGPGAVLPDVQDSESRVAWASDAGGVRDRKYIHIGEDVLFCLRAEDAGYRPVCAKVPGLRHYKTVPLTHDEVAEQAMEARG